MLNLPVIVAAGGINSAGRTSGHHAYRRMVLEHLSQAQQGETQTALSALMGANDRQFLLDHTLVRKIEPQYFDPAAVHWNRQVTLSADHGPLTFETSATRSAEALPRDWQVETLANKKLRVTVDGAPTVLFPSTRELEVSVAGQLPTGLVPGELYPSRNHPRALQMTVFAASDALADLGIDWDVVRSRVSPELMSVYVSSSMGQLDDEGSGGMLRARANGRRVSSKQCPLGFAQMPGDFVNAYLLRSLGKTGPAMGACATFLYNLQRGVEDIRSGRARVAVVGAVDAPITPEVMDGYIAMGALATDKGLRELDGLEGQQALDYRRACRPFGQNCGFVIAESAQIVVLFDDALALELGATIHGAVPSVFVHADGAKKSISGPGAGNYITAARAMATLQAILGKARLARGGLVQAHGTGTPQNRVTEACILNRVAQAFGVEQWPIAAIKSYVGHSLGAASADQLSATLGMFKHKLLPGIHTIDCIADDVAQDHLRFSLQTREIGNLDYALINSKGFGGNNASAALLSPDVTERLLRQAHGAKALSQWQSRHESVASQRAETEAQQLAGGWSPSYFFDDGVIDDSQIDLSAECVRLGGVEIPLTSDAPSDWQLD